MKKQENEKENPRSTPTRKRGTFGWKIRHGIVIFLAVAGTYGFLASRGDWSEMHRWNRAFGDLSLVLIAVSMLIGPMARLWPSWRRFIPWRREFGIHGVLLAIVHTVIILAGWVEWDLMRLVGYQFHPQMGRYVMVEHGFALANILGILALVYGGLLAMTSNDRSQRIFGGPVWKFIQQGAYPLWVLIVLHTAYFLYFHFQHFHRPLPAPNWGQWPFAVLVLAVLLFQFAAFIKTWRSNGKLKDPGDRGALAR